MKNKLTHAAEKFKKKYISYYNFYSQDSIIEINIEYAATKTVLSTYMVGLMMLSIPIVYTTVIDNAISDKLHQLFGLPPIIYLIISIVGFLYISWRVIHLALELNLKLNVLGDLKQEKLNDSNKCDKAFFVKIEKM